MTDLNLIENTPSQDQSLAVEIKNELSGRNVSPRFLMAKIRGSKKGWLDLKFWGISPWGIHENPTCESCLEKSSQMTEKNT